MIFTPRWYQHNAINAAVSFFLDALKRNNAIEILPTGSGKSLVIAEIARQLPGEVLVFQPSKEILLQNYAKFLSYGGRAGIYSASGGGKVVDKVTFATIKSVADKPHLFRNVKYIIVDECHQVNPEEGQYQAFFKKVPQAKVLGLTATPYRLTVAEGGSMLEFITRSIPRIFKEVLYYVQNKVLFDEGFLAPLDYYDMTTIDRSKLQMNKAGTDFTDASVRALYREMGMTGRIIENAKKILRRRNNLLVFCTLVSEAEEVAKGIPGARVLSGETDGREREQLEKDFKSGKVRCVVNVQCWDTGFDYPALEAVLVARSTMSLAIWYQIVGRVMRSFVYPDGTIKRGMVVDMGGNLKLFGKIETMEIRVDVLGQYCITNEGRQLTDVPFSKN